MLLAPRTFILLLSLALFASACAPKGKEIEGPLVRPTPANTAVVIAPPAPTAVVALPTELAFSATSITISVLSQVDHRNSPPSVDVRIECRDQLGDLCKAVGTLRMKLTGALASQTEYTFEVPLTTLTEQKLRWENVTSTYIARLAPPWAATIVLGGSVKVSATLVRADGSTITTSGDVR